MRRLKRISCDPVGLRSRTSTLDRPRPGIPDGATAAGASGARRVRRALTWTCAVVVLAAFTPARAEAPEWTTIFASLDAERADEIITRAVADGATSAAPRLFEAALAALHPDLAVSTGDAMRTLGGTWAESAGFQEMLEGALGDRDAARRANLARILGGWGAPWVDAPLATLSEQRRAPEVQEEALLMAGALPASDALPFPQTAEAILGALRSRRPAIRIAACLAAGRRRIAASTEALVGLALKDKERWVGMHAVRALERIDRPVELEAFVRGLRRTQPAPARAAGLKAVTTLARAGDVPLLVKLLKHKDEEVRHAAVLAVHTVAAPELFQAHPDAHPGLDAAAEEDVRDLARGLLRQSFSDEKLWRRRAAVHALERMGRAALDVVSEEAVRRLGGRDAEDAVLAAGLCAGLGLTAAYDALLDLAYRADDLAVRLAAARALERLAAARASRDLLAALEVRKRLRPADLHALEALGFVRHQEAVAGLVDLLVAPGWGQPGIQAIETALERLTGRRLGADAAAWRTWMAATTKLFPEVPAVDCPADRRRNVLKEGRYGFRPESDRAMARGLAWLERMRHVGGYWSGAEDGIGLKQEHQTTYTAFAHLAFLGAGYRPDGGRYRETLWRGAEFLAAVHRFDGRSPDRALDRSPTLRGSILGALGAYVVPSGLWALVEAWTFGGDTALRGPAQRGLDYIGHIARMEQGWGRIAMDEAYLSSTAMYLWAVTLGAGAGLEIDPWGLDGADVRLRLCSTDMTGTREHLDDLSRDFEHTVGPADTFRSFTAELPLSSSFRRERERIGTQCVNELAMLVRGRTGWERSHPAMAGWARWLAEAPPRWEGGPPGPPISWTHTYWWISSWAMFQMGGAYWRGWSDRLGQMFCEHQRLDDPQHHGSWDPMKGRTARGRLFVTATAVFALQSWYRYPPYLTR